MARNYQYVLYLDKKEVWRGKDPREKFLEIKKKHPNKKISVSWQSDDDILILAFG